MNWTNTEIKNMHKNVKYNEISKNVTLKWKYKKKMEIKIIKKY